MNKTTSLGRIANNKKAFFNYDISEKIECGIVLSGVEVKSIRQGHISIQDAYVRIIRGELWLVGAYIKPYDNASESDIDSTRDRKLLLRKREINRLMGRMESKQLLAVALAVYFKRNRVKIEIGLGTSKKKFDKRATIKKREVDRELDRARKRY